NMKTGVSFYSQAEAASAAGGCAYSTIRDCELKQISCKYVGDNILVDHNIIGFNISNTAAPDVFFYNVAGAANYVVTHNVISGGIGFVYCGGGTSPVIAFNELENANTTVTNLIDMAGSVSVVTTPLITGNSISQNAAAAVVPIGIENATGAIIENNRISKPTDTAKHIVISSAAVNTTIGVNKYANSSGWITSGFMSDAGTNTMVIAQTTSGTWSPPVTSGSGTITTASATGTYTKQDKLVSWSITITITTNGTGATDIQFNLPSASSALAVGIGKETTIGGWLCIGFQYATGLAMHVTKGDGTYPGGNGAVIILSGQYVE